MDGTDSDDSHLGADAQMDRLRAQARTHVTGAPGQQITWAEWGPADAPVLVMLHGAYGSWPHFVRNIEAFASTNRRQIVSFENADVNLRSFRKR